MKRRLSTSLFELQRVVFPASVLVFLALYLWAFGVAHAGEPTFLVDWFFVLSFLGFFFYQIQIFRSSKTVHRDEKNLYISDSKQGIILPFSRIAKVKETYFGRPKRIILHLKEPGPLGSKIMFIPETPLFYWSMTSHPITKELREAVVLASVHGPSE